VGSAPYLSGLFRDEPAVEAMNALKLDVSSVGNHEFDRGVDELLRLKYGGCSPTDGCPGGPFTGAAFDWLAGNVAYRDGVQPTVPDGAAAYGAWFSARTGRTVLPATSVRTVAGIKVGFIGLTLKGTSGLVRPQGVADVAFTDEVAATKLAAEDLTAAGAKAIVLLLHEGGYPPASAPYSFTCGSSGTVSGTVASLAKRITPDVDMIVSGHTHQPYLCDIPDPSGAPRWVTSAASFSRSVVEASIPLDPATGDVVRSGVTVVQHAVTRDVPADAAEQALVTTWRQREADSMIGGARRVGTLAAVATRSVSMSTESSLADLVADAQLEATAPQIDGASVAAFVDPVTIHGDLGVAVSGNRSPVAVSYKNAYRAMPLNHLVYSMTLTGAQIDTALEQQWRLGANGTVTTRMLGISGLTYTWSGSAPVGAKVDPTSIRIRGVVVNPVGRYRVTATSFMASGSSPFTVFKAGTNRVCGGVDLPVLRMYLANHVRLVPPTPTRGTPIG
jgi:2',3'-cyclic-nucleotide 2'-phosphodiesterase (5'-nucleotidase family)